MSKKKFLSWSASYSTGIHGLTVMSVETITVKDGVMFGLEVGLFTVNYEPKNIRVIMTKEIVIKKNA